MSYRHIPIASWCIFFVIATILEWVGYHNFWCKYYNHTKILIATYQALPLLLYLNENEIMQLVSLVILMFLIFYFIVSYS